MCNCHHLQRAQNTQTMVQLQHPGMIDNHESVVNLDLHDEQSTSPYRTLPCTRTYGGCRKSETVPNILEWGCKINLRGGAKNRGSQISYDTGNIASDQQVLYLNSSFPLFSPILSSSHALTISHPQTQML